MRKPFEIKLDGVEPVPTCQGRFMERGPELGAARETLALPDGPQLEH
jgi:hypothetical protein